MTGTLVESPDLDPLHQPEHHAVPSGPRKRRYGTHLFLIAMSVLWLAPLLWTIYTSLRSKADTDKHNYFSWPRSLTFSNYTDAWKQGGFGTALVNSAIIVIPVRRPRRSWPCTWRRRRRRRRLAGRETSTAGS